MYNVSHLKYPFLGLFHDLYDCAPCQQQLKSCQNLVSSDYKNMVETKRSMRHFLLIMLVSEVDFLQVWFCHFCNAATGSPHGHSLTPLWSPPQETIGRHMGHHQRKSPETSCFFGKHEIVSKVLKAQEICFEHHHNLGWFIWYRGGSKIVQENDNFPIKKIHSLFWIRRINSIILSFPQYQLVVSSIIWLSYWLDWSLIHISRESPFHELSFGTRFTHSSQKLTSNNADNVLITLVKSFISSFNEWLCSYLNDLMATSCSKHSFDSIDTLISTLYLNQLYPTIK